MDIIRAKWTMDGSTTLAEAAGKLREFADELDRMQADGWQLTGPVEDDYGYIAKPGEPDDEDDEDEWGEGDEPELESANG